MKVYKFNACDSDSIWIKSYTFLPVLHLVAGDCVHVQHSHDLHQVQH